MSAVEKKIAVALVVVLVAMIGVYFAVGQKEAGPLPGPGYGHASPAAAAHGGGGGEAEVMGSEEAALKIVAFVPTQKGCHDATVAVLKKAYEAHPDDIHLTLVDFLGPQQNEWKSKLGVTCATVEINGERSFELEGRQVTFQKAEGGTYIPADLDTVIEAELAKVKS